MGEYIFNVEIKVGKYNSFKGIPKVKIYFFNFVNKAPRSIQSISGVPMKVHLYANESGGNFRCCVVYILDNFPRMYKTRRGRPL